ncbi:Crp/Fnr family transcriptional regulator [Phyllobacterium sp. BT25]|uniref:Crp/Fnr family transcriptional regulator n=1 Tax=Phyllobacterium pellucidum TaxID=2740464 RepID=A0A849VY26_9HYPH|nr:MULTISPECIES: Crp/Fnr family transcriptional regulator [Phyllobacterium]NTS33207.1 Crp/Fnr family transcriptional regulator [Phyllobacterium pellucidum]UGY11512.1 Crp/Fnr family transcriptional regulator [Phyllobacterium sp. T1018]
MIESLLLNLESRDIVSEEEKSLLRSIITRGRQFEIDEDLVREGSRPTYSTLMLEGFAARYKVLDDGSRQITSLHIPGDFVDLHAFPLKIMDHGIVALSPCRVAFADHSALKTVTETVPHLTRLLWLSTLIDGAIHREWIVAMGRRSKKAHLAHLICELYVRLQVVQLTNEQSFHLPLSQVELADVVGISVVHLNKTLQSLRREKLVTWINRTVTIVDWEALKEFAEFNPLYLNLSVEAR